MKKWIKTYITEKKLETDTEKYLKSIYISSDRISVYLFLRILLRQVIKHDLNAKATSVAFSLTLSIFPFLLFLLALLPFLPINQAQIMEFLADAIPKGIYSFIDTTISDILSNKRQNLLSLSIIFAVYAASNGMASLITSFNSTFKYAKKRSFLRLRLDALLLTSVLSLVVLFATAFLIVGEFILRWLLVEGLLNQDMVYYMIIFLKYIIVFVVFFTAISFIYYIVPSSVKSKWNFFSFGAMVASVLVILVTNIFSYYLDNFATYNKVYGSIGTVIALMMWIYLLSLILLLGLELNACWMEAKETTNYERKISPDELNRRTSEQLQSKNTNIIADKT